jgi:hypothetical protein
LIEFAASAARFFIRKRSAFALSGETGASSF